MTAGTHVGLMRNISGIYLICPPSVEKSVKEKEVLKIVSHDHHPHENSEI